MSAVASALTTLSLQGYSINSIPFPFYVQLAFIAFLIGLSLIRRIFRYFLGKKRDDDNND